MMMQGLYREGKISRPSVRLLTGFAIMTLMVLRAFRGQTRSPRTPRELRSSVNPGRERAVLSGSYGEWEEMIGA
jgi:hypothetical protein